MKQLNRNTANVHQKYPARILQFGGGNFLRGFVDWIVHRYNQQSTHEKLGIVVVKVRAQGSYQQWKDQEGLYHLFTKGFKNGKTVDKRSLITSVITILESHSDWKEFLLSAQKPELNIITSNTTESGITFNANDLKDKIPSTFPGQLTAWLFNRYKFFKGHAKAGCILIPCELLIDNGQLLKEKVKEYSLHWNLDNEFLTWLDETCTFCNTLVDRIVTGVSKEDYDNNCERVGYNDLMMTEGEPYHLWAIECDRDIGAKLPLDRIGLNVFFTKDLSDFRERKLKILNGAHTAMVPIGMLLGVQTVGEFLKTAELAIFLEKLIFDEIVPNLEVDQESCRDFANEVLDRFRNPFLEHRLESISLNSISKFNTRVKPSLKAYINRTENIPGRITLALSCLLVYYRGTLADQTFTPIDDKNKISRLQSHWNANSSEQITIEKVNNILSDELLWEEDLSQIPGFSEKVYKQLAKIIDGKLSTLMDSAKSN